MKRVEAQEMVSRLRSKEDLYRYLTQHDKHVTYTKSYTIVGLFLPTMEGTKISFLKAILFDEKKAFKSNEIKLIEIQNYPKISVTNLQEDAMIDEELEVYLPPKNNSITSFQKRVSSLVFLSLQERVISGKIIEEAHKKRYSVSSEDLKKQIILISETLHAELKKHPYLSSQL